MAMLLEGLSHNAILPLLNYYSSFINLYYCNQQPFLNLAPSDVINQHIHHMQVPYLYIIVPKILNILYYPDALDIQFNIFLVLSRNDPIFCNKKQPSTSISPLQVVLWMLSQKTMKIYRTFPISRNKCLTMKQFRYQLVIFYTTLKNNVEPKFHLHLLQILRPLLPKYLDRVVLYLVALNTILKLILGFLSFHICLPFNTIPQVLLRLFAIYQVPIMLLQTYLTYDLQKPNYTVPQYNQLQHLLPLNIILLPLEIHF